MPAMARDSRPAARHTPCHTPAVRLGPLQPGPRCARAAHRRWPAPCPQGNQALRRATSRHALHAVPSSGTRCQASAAGEAAGADAGRDVTTPRRRAAASHGQIRRPARTGPDAGRYSPGHLRPAGPARDCTQGRRPGPPARSDHALYHDAADARGIRVRPGSREDRLHPTRLAKDPRLNRPTLRHSPPVPNPRQPLKQRKPPPACQPRTAAPISPIVHTGRPPRWPCAP
jgi:hypothetical protein